ncbi:MAG TPA: hypothetical protein VNZ86_15590, partial [Bacteroidia bacterium]|nr:hypothetical protein [Bacteroidia bacterium]
PADDLDSSLVSWVQIKELFYSKGLASEEKYYDTLSGTTTTILRNRKGRIRSRSIYTGHHDVYTAYDPRGRISLINYSRYFESMNNRNDWMESHEKGEYYAPNYVDSTVYFKKGIPITGTKQLKIRKKEYLKGELVNGKLNGTWIHYVKEHWVKDYSGKHHFVSKHIAAKAEFVNNKLNGEELIYDYNLECCYGKPSSPLVYLRARYHFNNNIQDGLELSYYPDGTLKDKTYFQDGKSNGPHLYYYPDGHTNDSCTLVNGKLNGVVKSWSKTGVLTRLDEYENGVRHGRTIQYDFNGIKEMEGLYEQGHHTGNWVHYFKSGNPNIRSHYFTPSELDSVRNLLHLQPLKKEKRSADREKKQVKDLATKNLSAVFYYENGQKAQQGCIVEGERKGLWIWWREDGSKEKEISYESGILHPGTADSVHYLGRIVSCYPDGSKMLEALVMDEDMKYDCQKEVYDPIHNLYFLNAWDEKGNPLISNGSGYFKLAGPDKLCPGEGPVKAGLKDGFWQYRDQNAKLNSIGTYRKGLKEGKWMDGDLTGTHTIENACYHNLTEKQMKELLEQLDVTVSWFRQGEVTREEGHSNIKISFSYKRNKLPRWMPSMDEINFNTEIQRTGWRYNELSQMHNSSSHGVLDTTNNDFY